MMKSSIKSIMINIGLCLLLLAVDANLCFADPINAGSNVIPIKTVFVKFAITMGSVLLSLLIIWILLYSYKKYSVEAVKEYNQKSLYGDNMKQTKTVGEAIVSFIEKNRL